MTPKQIQNLKNRQVLMKQREQRTIRLQKSKSLKLAGPKQAANLKAFRQAATKGDTKTLEKYAKKITSSITNSKKISEEEKNFRLGKLSGELFLKGVKSKKVDEAILKAYNKDDLSFLKGIIQKIKEQGTKKQNEEIEAFKKLIEDRYKEFYELHRVEIASGQSDLAKTFHAIYRSTEWLKDKDR